MAIPLTPTQMLTALRGEGVNVVGFRDWITHNRNHKGKWGPVHGVMIHHTVTGPDVMSTVRLCYDGHATLPGPLCHAVGGKDGKVYLVGHGRANHAGTGDGDVLDAVVHEHEIPSDNETDTDGNQYFYGIEIQNRGDGQDPYPAAQYEQAVRYAAALCRAHGWSARSVIGHSEWQPGKVDPSFGMDQFRTRVAQRLAMRTPGPLPSTPPATTEEPQMVQFTSLAMDDAPETLLAGQSRIVYWNAEYQDGSGDHGAGGKTIVSGEHVTGVVALRFSAPLPAGVKAYMVHELDAGGTSNDYVTALHEGEAEVSVPYTARIAEDRNLVFKIENTSGLTVVLDWAAARFGTWAL